MENEAYSENTMCVLNKTKNFLRQFKHWHYVEITYICLVKPKTHSISDCRSRHDRRLLHDLYFLTDSPENISKVPQKIILRVLNDKSQVIKIENSLESYEQISRSSSILPYVKEADEISKLSCCSLKKSKCLLTNSYTLINSKPIVLAERFISPSCNLSCTEIIVSFAPTEKIDLLDISNTFFAPFGVAQTIKRKLLSCSPQNQFKKKARNNAPSKQNATLGNNSKNKSKKCKIFKKYDEFSDCKQNLKETLDRISISLAFVDENECIMYEMEIEKKML